MQTALVCPRIWAHQPAVTVRLSFTQSRPGLLPSEAWRLQANLHGWVAVSTQFQESVCLGTEATDHSQGKLGINLPSFIWVVVLEVENQDRPQDLTFHCNRERDAGWPWGRLWEAGFSMALDDLMSLWFFCSSGSCAMRAPGTDAFMSVSKSSPPWFIFPVWPVVGDFRNGNLEDLYLSNMSLSLIVYLFFYK